MSHLLIFHILPFNPLVIPDSKLRLPIDLEDMAQQLRVKYPDGEVKFSSSNSYIEMYHPTKREAVWSVFQNLGEDDPSIFLITGYPKRLSRALIYWYRRFVPAEHPLFLVDPDSGMVVELKPDVSLDDIEKFYPYPIPED